MLGFVEKVDSGLHLCKLTCQHMAVIAKVDSKCAATRHN